MLSQIATFLNGAVPGADATVNTAAVGHSSLTVNAEKILEVCQALKSSPEFQMNVLQAITATDYKENLELTYVINSFFKNHDQELLLKVKLPRGEGTGNTLTNLSKINSVVSVWSAANFQEREAYDMIGVHFVGHPDHRRVLCPDEWQGYPLRKDYVVQEKYLDMVVNPPWKNNTEDQAFGQNLRDQIGDPKLVSYSWKGKNSGDNVGEESDEKDGE
jgi:NADH-quinone oxidoreductase subunit C